MTGAPPIRGRSAALRPAGLLLAGALVVVLGAILGTAHTFDGSTPGRPGLAVWAVALPAVVALVVAARRPVFGLAVVAGAGLIGVARLLSDLELWTSPNTAVRPEFFYETTTRAQPFGAAGGAAVVLFGDAAMVLAGALAARALIDRLTVDSAPIFAPPAAADTFFGDGMPRSALGVRQPAAPPVAAVADEQPRRNNYLVVTGFVGVLALLAASLGLPYTGGYLSSRYLPAELGLTGVAAALVTGLLGAVAVLVAAALPRRVAVALLGGVAAGAAVPFLTALAARAAGTPVQLTPSVAVGLIGAAVVAVAGFAGRSRPFVLLEEPESGGAARADAVGAVLSLLTAGAAVAAWRLPQLHYNGGADPPLPGGFAISAPLAAPFVVAAVVPLVAAALWFVPTLAGAGRAVATVAWLPLLFAGCGTLTLLGQVVSSASVPNAGFALPSWTAGPGLWSAVAGVVTGVSAAAVSITAGRRRREESAVIEDDESLTESRRRGTLVAGVLTLGVLAVGLLPTYSTAAGSAGTVLVGFRLDSWGVLALSVGMVASAFAGGRARLLTTAVACPLAGAAISTVRLVVPAAVRAQDGFELGPGWYAGWLLVVLFVGAAVMFAFFNRRIETVTMRATTPRGRVARPTKAAAKATSGAAAKPAAQQAARQPTGKRPVPRRGASSSKAAKGRW